jgi:hypothetical protein
VAVMSRIQTKVSTRLAHCPSQCIPTICASRRAAPDIC